MTLGLGAQILDIDIAVIVAIDDHHAHAGHRRAGRVGAVRGTRDQADVARILVARAVVMTDCEQPGIFALRARVGLERQRVVTGALEQRGAQLAQHLGVARALLARGERVHAGKRGPGDGDHLAGGVEFHGAGTERNHRTIQRDIALLEFAQVAQHLGFRMVAVEDRMREIAALAHAGGRYRIALDQRVDGIESGRLVTGENTPHRLYLGARAAFIETDADAGRVERA